MRRFLTILLFCAFYMLFGVSGLQNECAVKYDIKCLSLSAADDSGESDLEFLRQWGSDMIRTSGLRNLVNFEETSTVGGQNNLRQRNSSEIRFTPHLVPCRHLGHVTHIFDYDNFRSSLRNGYYLHSLCRLRI